MRAFKNVEGLFWAAMVPKRLALETQVTFRTVSSTSWPLSTVTKLACAREAASAAIRGYLSRVFMISDVPVCKATNTGESAHGRFEENTRASTFLNDREERPSEGGGA